MSPQNELVPAFHLPLRSKSYSLRSSNNFSGSVPGNNQERTAFRFKLGRRLAGDAKRGALSPEARLRGGAGRDWAGKFEWLNTNESSKKTTLDKNEVARCPSTVTGKGKEIGMPQPAPAMNVLTPASRFARGPEVPTASTTRTSFGNSDDANNSPISTKHDCSGAYMQATLQPLSQALLPTQSRPATTNPFAGVYGNPHAVGTGPTSPPIDYESAGSLVNRLSALDGSQTGYVSRLNVSRRSPPRPDRKWGALPPPPRGKGGNEADDESFNTEEVLASLRPERLSFHHITTPVRSITSSKNGKDAAVASAQRRSPDQVANTRPIDHSTYQAPDNSSIPTRYWGLHSCNTTELGIDTQLRRQEKSPRLYSLPQEQHDQLDIRNDNELVYGLPEEDATNPESWFYAEMIEIVNDYHEQLQNVVQRAYEAGQTIEEQWTREKWTNRVVLDRKLRIAEDMSGYKILTNEYDIKQAIQHPTRYAIYSSLLKIRDPETWRRIFEPITTYAPLGTIMSTSQQPTPAPMSTFMWLLCKIGRGLCFMLAVPDDPDLKTYSSRRPPAPDTVTDQSNVSVLGPNVPFHPQESSRPAIAGSTMTLQGAASRDFVPYDQPRPSIQTERTPKLSTDTTRVNNNTTFTGVTLASPLNGRIAVAPRGRGYDQGAFVTNLAPSVSSKKSERATAGYGAGKATKKQGVRDNGTEITAWPEAKS